MFDLNDILSEMISERFTNETKAKINEQDETLSLVSVNENTDEYKLIIPDSYPQELQEEINLQWSIS
jgi:hypothetical protein